MRVTLSPRRIVCVCVCVCVCLRACLCVCMLHASVIQQITLLYRR